MSQIVEVALKYEGFPAVRYRGSSKGNTPEGFDCSGFVQFVLLESGLWLPRHPKTNELIRHSEEFFDHYGVFVHTRKHQAGDLVFFSRTGIKPTHIGICIDNGKMIHSQGRTHGTIRVVSIDEYVSKLPSLSNSPMYDHNPIGFKRPAEPNSPRYQRIFS